MEQDAGFCAVLDEGLSELRAKLLRARSRDIPVRNDDGVAFEAVSSTFMQESTDMLSSIQGDKIEAKPPAAEGSALTQEDSLQDQRREGRTADATGGLQPPITLQPVIIVDEDSVDEQKTAPSRPMGEMAFANFQIESLGMGPTFIHSEGGGDMSSYSLGEEVEETHSSRAFELDLLWIEGEGKGSRARISEIHDTSEATMKNDESSTIYAGHRCIMVNPDSGLRVSFVGIGAFLIFYDMLMLPLLFAEIVPSTVDFVEASEWVSIAYWSLDLISNFFTGFHKDLAVIYHPVKVAMHYIKGWFFCDVMIVLVDVVILISTHSKGDSTPDASSIVGATRLARMLRIARVLRLVRVARLVRVSSDWLKRISLFSSDFVVIISRVVRLLFFVLVLNHYIACAWYSIGKVAVETHESWMSDREADVSYLYAAAFHWSLTQFTPATQNIAPGNAFERVFAILVVFVALLTFSTLLGKMTTAMTQLLNLNSKRDIEQRLLRRFFNQYALSESLRLQIFQSWQQQSKSASNLGSARDQVPYLAEMPKRVQMKLDVELRMPHLVNLKIFELSERFGKRVLHLICHFAMSERSGVALEEIFMPGSVAKEALCLSNGSMKYENKHMCGGPVMVEPTAWICEAVLWGDWTTHGWLVAETSCQWVALDAKAFRTQVAPYLSSPFGNCLRKYARKFYRSANDTSLTLFDVAVGEQDEWRRSKMAISSVPEQVAAAGWMPARTAFLRRIGSSGTAFGERA
mmetsp:Transcript_88761/g.286844  ORF Transcript_88761/g.286844 Transcript_88761/m.286844 type:complete len:746 (+) Transcript_88761:128-2365(+)